MKGTQQQKDNQEEWVEHTLEREAGLGHMPPDHSMAESAPCAERFSCCWLPVKIQRCERGKDPSLSARLSYGRLKTRSCVTCKDWHLCLIQRSFKEVELRFIKWQFYLLLSIISGTLYYPVLCIEKVRTVIDFNIYFLILLIVFFKKYMFWIYFFVKLLHL